MKTSGLLLNCVTKLFNETFLVKGKSEILKYFLYSNFLRHILGGGKDTTFCHHIRKSITYFQQEFTNSSLFTLDQLPLLLLLRKNQFFSSQKSHSKVYNGNPIAPSFYSISPWSKLCFFLNYIQKVIMLINHYSYISCFKI